VTTHVSAHQAHHTPTGGADDEPPRALVVDDAATVRLFHAEILRRAGFTVQEAANGYEALEQALAARYDLMLIDVNMPRMDGVCLVRRLRDHPVAVTCPIVTISTEAKTSDTEVALRAGANLYLVKPANTDRLLLLARTVAGTVAATRTRQGAS
jgi:two-component system chemotaxis response regulator CheY